MSKSIDVYEDSHTLVKRGFLIAIKFLAVSQIRMIIIDFMPLHLLSEAFSWPQIFQIIDPDGPLTVITVCRL